MAIKYRYIRAVPKLNSFDVVSIAHQNQLVPLALLLLRTAYWKCYESEKSIVPGIVFNIFTYAIEYAVNIVRCIREMVQTIFSLFVATSFLL